MRTCWKHEWARAINNIEWAKIHVRRARLKVEKRGMNCAAGECDIILSTLEEAQETLKDLINVYGISQKASPSSLDRHMKGQRTKRGQVEAWVKAY